jgi:outer membrane protein TolC
VACKRPKGENIFRFCAGLLIGLTLCLSAQAAAAATLGQLLKSLDSSQQHSAPCLTPPSDITVPGERPLGPCSANIVGVLYLDLLRDRARLEVIRAAITGHRDLLAQTQRRVETGVLRSGDSLLVEVELKHWQRRETLLVAAVSHAELFFRAVMESEPTEFVPPRWAPSAWPADEAAALLALEQQEGIPENERPATRTVLKHSWIDYEAARRDLDLLQPMQAFAEDLARATGQQYEIGQVGTATLQERFRDATLLRDALATAEYRLFALQFQILEIIGRRPAIE